jgi:hypothetical protein
MVMLSGSVPSAAIPGADNSTAPNNPSTRHGRFMTPPARPLREILF